MLKAVRFDPEEHADLLDYIENYRDKKNRPNHSEAIRNLMIQGLRNSLSVPEETPQPSIDIEAMKTDIFNQLMAKINMMGIQQPIITEQPKIQEPVIQETPAPPKINKPKPTLPADMNPLLANLLGNSNR